MAFPLTHLLVAGRILEKYPATDLFVLGSIAPDAIHYRASLQEASQSNIGPAKKITHLCPVSDEKWGYVTDNKSWIECVRLFMRQNSGPLVAGYAVHVLTDIYNNIGIWRDFCNKYPEEAAKGYKSDYYRDMRNIDLRLYHEMFKNSPLREMLQSAKSQDIPGLIARSELEAIQNNLLNVAYANAPEDVCTDDCFYVTYEQTLKFIDDAAEFCIHIII